MRPKSSAYNTPRPHQALGYKSPTVYGAQSGELVDGFMREALHPSLPSAGSTARAHPHPKRYRTTAKSRWARGRAGVARYSCHKEGSIIRGSE